MEDSRLKSLMLTISGIRGVLGESLTPDIIEKYISRFAAMQKEKCDAPKVVLGYDTRPSVAWIKHCVIGTLMACGCEVIDLGVVPTPTVQLLVINLNATCGIVITASHNPQQWCGLKFIDSTGIFLDAAQCDKLFNGALALPYAGPSVSWKHTNYQSAIAEHIQQILELPYIDQAQIAQKHFKVAVDCINGAGSIAIPQLLRTLGCEVVELNTTPSGIFSHPPEPIPENLQDLCSTVVANSCDIGIAVDPDSDRCVLINEKGEPLVEEYTLALAVYLLLKHYGITSPVCKNVSTTRAIDELCSSFSVPCHTTAIGEVNVAVKMVETSSTIGGEGNGGVMLTDLHIGRDALIAAALILQLMTTEPQPISAIKSQLPQWFIHKKRLDLAAGTDLASLIAQWRTDIIKTHGTAVILNEVDGLRVDHQDWWVHVRRSNTEPIIRVIGEGRTPAAASDICDSVLSQFQSMLQSQ